MAKYYPRAFAIAEGRKLVHKDIGGGLRFNAIGSFVANPLFGAHPANVLQPGGFTSPPTSPAAMMMASQAAQQGMASGGEVDEASYRHACSLLHAAKRACGGAVRADGGRLDNGKPDFASKG